MIGVLSFHIICIGCNLLVSQHFLFLYLLLLWGNALACRYAVTFLSLLCDRQTRYREEADSKRWLNSSAGSEWSFVVMDSLFLKVDLPSDGKRPMKPWIGARFPYFFIFFWVGNEQLTVSWGDQYARCFFLCIGIWHSAIDRPLLHRS